MTLQVKILTPTGSLYQGEAKEVLIPSVKGQTGILPQHAKYVTALEEGEVLVTNASGVIKFSVSGGFCEVEQDRVVILADQATRIS